MKTFDKWLPHFVVTLLFLFTFCFGQTVFGQQIGETDTPFDTDGWDLPEDSTKYYKLPIYRLLSNPGGWINWNQFWVDSLFNELIVYTDTNQLFIRNDTLFLNDNFIENAIAGLDTLKWISLTPQTTNPLHVEGRMFYDSLAHALVMMNDESEVSQQLGHEMWVRVYNPSAVLTIDNGSVVYPVGATAEGIGHVALAQADSDATSNVLGIATHDIEPQTYGYITRFGQVNSLNTLALTPLGSTIWLSGTVAGGITSTKPSAPANAFPLGGVTRIDNDSGSVFASMTRFDPINGEAFIGFADSSVSVTVSSSGVPYRITSATNTLFQYDASIGHDITLSGDTLYLAEVGVYNVVVSFSFEAGASGVFKFMVYNQGTAVPNASGRRKTSSSDVGNVGFSCVVNATVANSALTFWFVNTNNTQNPTFVDGTVTVAQVR